MQRTVKVAGVWRCGNLKTREVESQLLAEPAGVATARIS